MNINEILSSILLIIVLSVFFITLKNNTNEPFLQSCGTSFSQQTDNCGRHKSKQHCDNRWQSAAHTGGKGPLKCVWSESSNKCKKDDPCSTEHASAMDAARTEADRLAREAEEAAELTRIAEEKEIAKNAACGPIDNAQYDTPDWSYGGVIQPCPNYIDPAIEEQNKENERIRICGSTISQSNTKEWSYNGVIQGECENYSEPISNPTQPEPINYSTQHLRISPTHVFVTNSIEQ